LFEHMPESIEYIEIVTGDDALITNWTAALQNNMFAPYLKRFHIQSTDCYNKAVAAALVQTIMEQTGSIRPVHAWHIVDDSELMQQLPLNMLVTRDISRNISSVISADAWPDLQRVKARIVNVDGNLSALLGTLSCRPIVELQLTVSLVVDSLPWDNISTQALSSMHCLTYLKLDECLAFDSSLLTTGCWPQLELLDVASKDLNQESLGSLLRAAPNCTQVCVDVKSRGMSPTLALAMVGSLCLLARRIDIIADPSTRKGSEHRADAKSCFERYPCDDPNRPSFRHLVCLTMCADHCCPGAFHHIVSVLSTAPQLRWAEMWSPWTVMMRALPHLITIQQLSSRAQGKSKLDRKIIQQCVEWKRGSARKSNLVQSSFDRPHTQDDLANEWFGELTFYPVFKSITSSGIDGRKEFFDFLYLQLSSTEQQQLRGLDEGRAPECCCERGDAECDTTVTVPPKHRSRWCCW
jgi:hypothetical protein